MSAWDTLMDRLGIASDAVKVADRLADRALADAVYETSPRVILVDAERRVVRVVNAPPEARLSPPPFLAHWSTDTVHKSGVERVGHLHAVHGRDLDYVLPQTRAGDDLIALLADGVEPSVQVRHFSSGATDLPTLFEA